MAMIRCVECGKEISDMADKCVHCGCPVNNEFIIHINNQPYNLTRYCPNFTRQQFIYYLKTKRGLSEKDCEKICDDAVSRGIKFRNKPYKKKESSLSVAACACAFFIVTSPIGFILGCVDLSKNDDTEKHTGSWFAIIVSVIISILACMSLL